MDEKHVIIMENENIELKNKIEFLEKKCHQQAEAYQHLLHSFKEFQRQRFGSRSEKYKGSNPLQEELFEKKNLPAPLNTSSETQTPTTNNVIDIKSHQRKRNAHKRLPAGLPHREVIIPAENKLCGCGKEKHVIRYEITELLNYQPAIFEVIVQKREVVACDNECPQSIAIAANPKRVLPKTLITADLLAHVIVSKLHDRQPHYHFEKRLIETLGFTCRRNKLSRWFIESAEAIQPVVNLVKESIWNYDVASCDATSLQVLREPNRAPQISSYAFCMRGGPPDKRVIVYEYNAVEHKAFLQEWFADFTGYLHVDAQNIFEDLAIESTIQLVNCNAHARRKFEVIAKQTTSTDGLSHHALRFYQKVYRLDRGAKRLSTPEAVKQFRQEHIAPLFTEFKAWLDHEYPTLLPQSPIGKAFQYAINHWPALIRFLDDGRLEIDNNLTEQQIKSIVMARKNFLFATSVNGAKALCNHLSLVRTAVLHNLDPYRYYVDILKKIPYCQSLADFEALLPWNISVPKVKLLKTA